MTLMEALSEWHRKQMLVEEVEQQMKKNLSRNLRVRKPVNIGNGLGKKVFSSIFVF